jgi:hypothetical protein
MPTITWWISKRFCISEGWKTVVQSVEGERIPLYHTSQTDSVAHHACYPVCGPTAVKQLIMTLLLIFN